MKVTSVISHQHLKLETMEAQVAEAAPRVTAVEVWKKQEQQTKKQEQLWCRKKLERQD